MSFNFLIQATRVLHSNGLENDEVEMVTNFVLAIENDVLIDYYNTCTLLSYDNDLQLYIEIIDSLISIHEIDERYEICEKLKKRKEECLVIINNKKI